jgi:malonyl-CoA/methylmalonyl-CoA synthetase
VQHESRIIDVALRLMIALDELPRNGIGKVLRGAIRADLLARFRITGGPRPRLEPRD